MRIQTQGHLGWPHLLSTLTTWQNCGHKFLTEAEKTCGRLWYLKRNQRTGAIYDTFCRDQQSRVRFERKTKRLQYARAWKLNRVEMTILSDSFKNFSLWVLIAKLLTCICGISSVLAAEWFSIDSLTNTSILLDFFLRLISVLDFLEINPTVIIGLILL